MRGSALFSCSRTCIVSKGLKLFLLRKKYPKAKTEDTAILGIVARQDREKGRDIEDSG